MGPPLASLSKARFSLAPDTHHAPVEDDESEDNQYAYKLLLFAREELFEMQGCQGSTNAPPPQILILKMKTQGSEHSISRGTPKNLLFSAE